MGIYSRSYGQLAAVDQPVAYAGLRVVWIARRGASFGEHLDSLRQCHVAFSGVAWNDGRRVEKCFCGDAVCVASVACGIGGVGVGEEGCAEYTIFHAYAVGVCALCGTQETGGGQEE